MPVDHDPDFHDLFIIVTFFEHSHNFFTHTVLAHPFLELITSDSVADVNNEHCRQQGTKGIPNPHHEGITVDTKAEGDGGSADDNTQESNLYDVE